MKSPTFDSGHELQCVQNSPDQPETPLGYNREQHEEEHAADFRKNEDARGLHNETKSIEKDQRENTDSICFHRSSPDSIDRRSILETNVSDSHKPSEGHRGRTSRSRHRNRLRNKLAASYDPMIQTISETSKNVFEDFPASLSLSLTEDLPKFPDEHASPPEYHKSKLHRRRSPNVQVEAMVSKAMENLTKQKKNARRKSSHHSSFTLNKQMSCSNQFGEYGKSQPDEQITLPIDNSQMKSKEIELGAKHAIKKKRLSDTGILGQIGYCTPKNIKSELKRSETEQSHQIDQFNMCIDEKDSHKETQSFLSLQHRINTPIEFTPKNNHSFLSQSFSNQTNEEDSGFFDTPTSIDSTFDDDSSYDGKEEEIHCESSEDDDFVQIVAERLWDGSVLKANGSLGSSNVLEDEERNFNYDYETDSEVVHDGIKKKSMDKSVNVKLDTQFKKSDYRRTSDSTSDASYSVKVETLEKNENESQDNTNFVPTVEIIGVDSDNNDDEINSSEYSTDTDHETDEDEMIVNSPSLEASSTISPVILTRLGNSEEIKTPHSQSQYGDQCALPRFKIDSVLSPDGAIGKKYYRENQPPNLSSSASVVTTISKHEFVKPNKWSLGSQIGAGTFGVVHVGMNDLTGNLMAVKILRNIIPDGKSAKNSSLIREVQSEIDLMRSFSHPNIVRYFGAERKGRTLYIFQEWVPGGSLSSLLRKFGSFTTSVVRRYLYQILQGLHYLHSNHVLHRDIKGGNILVDDRGSIKLADFGASKQLFPSSSMTESINSVMMQSMTMKGTPYFMAPEVFEQKYNKKADIWSVGGVILQMVTCDPPWKSLGFQSPMSLFYHLKSTDGPPPIKADIGSQSLRRIVESCFEREPERRPGAGALLKEGFFKEDEDYDIERNNDFSDKSIESSLSFQNKETNAKVLYKESKTKQKGMNNTYINVMKNITNTDKCNSRLGHKQRDHENSTLHYYSNLKSEENLNERNRIYTSSGIQQSISPLTSKSDDSLKRHNSSSSNLVMDEWPSWAKKHEQLVQNKNSTNTCLKGFRPSNPFRSELNRNKSESTKDVDSAAKSISSLAI